MLVFFLSCLFLSALFTCFLLQVFSLLAAFPRLRQLNVSFNPFAKPADSAAPGGDAMSEITPAAPAAAAVEHTGLKTLIVNGTFCPWTLVHTFLSQCTR